MIQYKNFSDLSNTIRSNIWKIPDIDLIVGIPRSGMMCAILISTILNKPVMSIDDFLENKQPTGGNRMTYMSLTNFKNILILDDNVASGKAMTKIRKIIDNFNNKDKYNFIFGCVYVERPFTNKLVDIYLEDIYVPGVNLYLYEWNIMHFDPRYSETFMCDIDGILCKDPPHDEAYNVEEYEEYIANAKPMVIPSRKIGAYVTYRQNKYREITTNWLNSVGAKYGDLYMINSNSYEERASIASPSMYKAYVYKNTNWARLFIESDINQAIEIFRLTNKPVFCYTNGIMYQ